MRSRKSPCPGATPFRGDEFGSFPGGGRLRREGSHPHEGLQLTGAV